MHPGPMNRGVEIAPEVADLPQSTIVEQVRHGVAVRMAVLFLLLAAEPSAGAAERVRALASTTSSRWCRKGSDDARHPRRSGDRRHRGARSRTCSSTTAASSRSAPTSTGDTRARRRRLHRRPRPGRPPHAPAPARPGGGRDGRDRQPVRRARRLHRGRRHAQHRPRPSTAPRVVREVQDLGAKALCDVHPAAAITDRPGRRAALADGRDGRRSACGCSPTTAPACRTTG